MKSCQCDQEIIPSEQKFNLRGVWNPLDGEPILPSKYDAYIVGQCYGEFETGDWIIRDESNSRFIHIPIGIISTAVKQSLALFDGVTPEEFGININRLETKINSISEGTSEGMANMIGDFNSKFKENSQRLDEMSELLNMVINKVME